MLIILGLLIGAGLGARNARARGGNGMDMAQYAAVGGIIGGLAGVVATIVLERLL